MKQFRIANILAPAIVVAFLSAPTLAVATEKANLSGAEEVPAISTTGSGEF